MDATQDPTPSLEEARGRHRAASASRWGTRQLLAVVVAVLVLLVLGAAAAVALRDSSAPGSAPTGTGPAPGGDDGPGTSSPATASTGPTQTPPVTGGLGLRRTVTVKGDTVTVVERYLATDAAPVVIAPQRGSDDPTLVPLDLQVVEGDRSTTPFVRSVTVNAGGTVTVRGQYRLRYCPDLVPLAWPTTSRVTSPGVPVQVVRSDEPLRTARSVCPGVPPQATAAPGLRVQRFAGRGGQATVRLVWSGAPTTVQALGAPGGFPLATVPQGCGDDGSGSRAVRWCVARLRDDRPVTLPLRPVDGCPTRFQRSNGLPLLISRGGRGEVVSVSVPGLGRWFVGACR